MTWLIIGISLWYAGHFWKRILPGAHAGLGAKAKGLSAAVIGIGLILMIIGVRGADFVPLYTPLPGMGHLVNLLMLVSIFLFGAGDASGVTKTKLRHPMLTGMVVWAGAHLLVNGDLVTVVLFASLAIWALLEMVVINRASPAWQRPERGPFTKDLKLALVTVMLYAIISFAHFWLGYHPFLGTYG